MGTPRNIATLPVSIDMDAMFEALRPQIEALVSERVKAALEAREGAPEIMKPAAAARYLNISGGKARRLFRLRSALFCASAVLCGSSRKTGL